MPPPDPNDQPLDDFAGLSARQVHQLLHDFLGSDSVVQLNSHTKLSRQDIPLLRMVTDLLDRLAEQDIVLTEADNLPGTHDHLPAGVVKHLTLILGWTKKQQNRLSLTARGASVRDQDDAAVFRQLFLGHLQRFNLGWADGFAPSSALQHVFGYLAYLLLRYGATERPIAEYAVMIRRAFPPLAVEFPHEQLTDGIAVRLFERFLAYYGLVTLRASATGYPRQTTVVTTERFRTLFRLSHAPANTERAGKRYSSAELPMELVAALEAEVDAFEATRTATETVPIQHLLAGVPILPPEDIPDPATATRESSRITHALAKRGVLIGPEAAQQLDARAYYDYLYHDLLTYAIAGKPSVEAPYTVSYAQVRMAQLVPTEAVMEYFLLALFRLDVPFPADVLAPRIRLGDRQVTRQRALNEIAAWRARWSAVQQLAFDAVPLPAGEDRKAPPVLERFIIAYEVVGAPAASPRQYAGAGEMVITLDREAWRVSAVAFPGFMT